MIMVHNHTTHCTHNNVQLQYLRFYALLCMSRSSAITSLEHHCYAEPTDSSPWDCSTSVVTAIAVVSYLSDCSTLIFGLI